MFVIDKKLMPGILRITLTYSNILQSLGAKAQKSGRQLHVLWISSNTTYSTYSTTPHTYKPLRTDSPGSPFGL